MDFVLLGENSHAGYLCTVYGHHKTLPGIAKTLHEGCQCF